jgi:hypothetical protein
MGAIERQVAQVKRKNSTSCNPPEARLTVVGSVASRFGPREVATGRGEAVRAAAGATAAIVASPVAGMGDELASVWLEAAGVGAGAQADTKVAITIRPVSRRIFVIGLLMEGLDTSLFNIKSLLNY